MSSAAKSARALALALAAVSAPALAHKSSDAYLLLDVAADRVSLRVDVALRDLDVALDLDADGDGRLSWGEVKAAWPRIAGYVAPRVDVSGCAKHAVGAAALERRNDGTYAVLRFEAACAVPARPSIRYALLGDVDPTHRGIARIQRGGEAPLLVVLDPAAASIAAAMVSGSAADAGTSAAAAASGGEAPPSRWQFLAEGVRHILTGYDHVLFLICLLLPAVVRRGPAGWRPVDRVGEAIWPVVGIVTAFTVAHSITLGLAATKLVSLPSSFIEPAIAVTIVLAALDNLVPVFPVRRIVVAFCFGLIHGFGFASVLAELNLPAADFAWALLQFNLGLEAGQLAVVTVATSLLFALRRWDGYRRVIVGGGSLVAIAIAAAWFVERVAGVSILPI